ncbi:hypothetical protein LINGRAHAP2_LOCUS23455 [Linum grandiflorum]
MLSVAASMEIITERKRARTFQFLMHLRPEFEQVRSQLLAANKSEIQDILGELIRAETRLKTQAQLDNLVLPPQPGNVFAAGRPRPKFFNQSKMAVGSSSFSATGQSNLSNVRCHHCQELGHYISLCRKRNICTYCKKPGHLITDCNKRAANNARTGRNNQTSGYSVQGLNQMGLLQILVRLSLQLLPWVLILARWITWLMLPCNVHYLKL